MFIPDLESFVVQEFHNMLNEKTKLVSMVYISNVLGAVLPVEQVAEAAHKVLDWLPLNGACGTL